MAVSFVGATSGNSGTATDTSQATSFHASWQANDVAVLFSGFGGNSLTLNSGTTGWTALPSVTNPQTQGTASRAYAFYRRLQGGDAAPTIGFSGSITGGWTMLIFRGGLLVGTPIGQNSVTLTSGTSFNLANLTGVLAGSMLGALYHARVPSGTSIPSQFTPDADYTQDASAVHATNRTVGTSQNLRYGGAYRAIAANGNYGGDTFTTDQTSSLIAFHFEVLAEPTEQVISITQVTETDTAQGLTVVDPKLIAVTQVTNTETAQALTPVDPKLIEITQVTDSETAQTITAAEVTTVTATQVTETDTAQSLTLVDPKLIGITQVNETDTAQGLTRVDPLLQVITQVSESDTAQSLTVSQGDAPETFNADFEGGQSRWARALTITDAPDATGSTSRVNLDECVGQRMATFRWELLDGVTGIRKGEIHPDRGATPTLSHDTGRTIKRMINPVVITPDEIGDVNQYRDRIDLFMVFGEDLEFPLGRFMFSDLTVLETTAGDWGTATLLDEMFRVDQPLETSFSILPSTIWTGISESVDEAVRRLLRDIDVDIVAEPTPYYSAGTWTQGTRRGSVIGDLAQFGDYLSPWFGNDRKLHLRRVFDPADVAPNFDWDERRFVIRDSISRPSDLLNLPNRIVVVSNDAVNAGVSIAQSPIVGTYDIPASAPFSIVNRGFVSQETVTTQVNSTLQAAAIAKAIGLRTLAAERVEVSTPPDPRHDSYDVIRFRGENWLELSWSLPLEEGSEMRHVLRRSYQ